MSVGLAQPTHGSVRTSASSTSPTGGTLGSCAPQTAVLPSPVMPSVVHQIRDLPFVVETAILTMTVLSANRSLPGRVRSSCRRYRLESGLFELR